MSALRDLIAENPMTFEGTRIWRRFVRSGSETGRAVNAVSLFVLGLLYVWLLLVIVRFREDLSQMFLTFELLTLTVAVPAALYGAVSGEREKQTWDSLVMTRLSPGQILTGKLLWRLVLIVVTMAAFAVPTFMSHFVSQKHTDYTPAALAGTQLLLLAWSLLLGGFTLLISAKTKRSITTLSVVVVALLAYLGLVPSLFALFGGRPLVPNPLMRSDHYSYGRYAPPRSPLETGGGLMVAAHPFFAMQSMQSARNGMAMRRGNDDGAILVYGSLVTAVYLLGAWGCLTGTLRTLRRLELPENQPAAPRTTGDGGESDADR